MPGLSPSQPLQDFANGQRSTTSLSLSLTQALLCATIKCALGRPPGDNSLVFEVFFWTRADAGMQLRKLRSDIQFLTVEDKACLNLMARRTCWGELAEQSTTPSPTPVRR